MAYRPTLARASYIKIWWIRKVQVNVLLLLHLLLKLVPFHNGLSVFDKGRAMKCMDKVCRGIFPGSGRLVFAYLLHFYFFQPPNRLTGDGSNLLSRGIVQNNFRIGDGAGVRLRVGLRKSRKMMLTISKCDLLGWSGGYFPGNGIFFFSRTVWSTISGLLLTRVRNKHATHWSCK